MKKLLAMCAACFCFVIVFSCCTASGKKPETSPAPSEASIVDGEASSAAVPERYEFVYREMTVESGDHTLYGMATIPETDSPPPLAVFSHGLCGSYTNASAWTEELASRGIAVYAFDFYGGSEESRSGGSTQEMSVMTEAEDLKAVLKAVRESGLFDNGKIILIGESQGGFVSAVTAAGDRELAGMILCYPAFVIRDEMREQFSSEDDIDRVYTFNWFTAGRPYAADIWDYDVYNEIGAYDGPVLLLHGDMDALVPLSYSQRALEVYENAALHVISGAGHGFVGAQHAEAMETTLDFLREIGMLPSVHTD